MKSFILLIAANAMLWPQSAVTGPSSEQGTATWIASVNSAPVLVSIGLSPANPTAANGASMGFSAVGVFSDGSTQDVTQSSIWSTGTPSVVVFGTLGSQQPALCISVGSSLISATQGSVSGSTTLSCSGALGENTYCTGTSDNTCFATAQSDGPAALPTSGMYTGMDGTPANGTVVGPIPLSQLQAAINSATCGERILVQAQSSPGVQDAITTSFQLPAHGCTNSNWIWIASDQYQNQAGGFPSEHVRATPCAVNQAAVAGEPTYPCLSPAFLMPKVICQSATASCFMAQPGATFYRIIGFEMANGNFNNDGNGVVDLSAGGDHVIFDRYLLHGDAPGCVLTSGSYTCSGFDLKNGFQLGGATNFAAISGWAYHIACPQRSCSDAHAFGGGNSDLASHTYKLWNNLIDAGGENLLQGGGGDGTSAVVTPTDFEIRANWFFKPVEYELGIPGINGCGVTECGGTPGTEVKNLFEIKNGSRGLIEGNEFENNWTGWQTDEDGTGMHFNPANQGITKSGCCTVTSDGAGNLVATSGTFPSSAVSSLCAVAGHCRVAIGGAVAQGQWLANVYSDSTHLSVIAKNGSGTFPAAGTGLSASVCEPGLNVNAQAFDWTLRYNEFRNMTNGVEFDNPPSDCGDLALGTGRYSAHDNLLQGINNDASNGNSGSGGPNAKARCFFVANAVPTGVTNSVSLVHNTCTVIESANAYNVAGFDVHLEQTATTSNGSTGSYLSNMTVAWNIGPGGGLFNYDGGGVYPGGAAAALKQMSCTPPVTGTTCSWTYTGNVLGMNQFPNQTNNTPFPASNITCGSATCFPSGTAAFAAMFASYTGPGAQPGYAGNYALVSGPYSGADNGKDIGANIAGAHPNLNDYLNGVRSGVTYNPILISTASLPNATHGVAYSTQISGSGASDMVYFTVSGGTLCSGFSLASSGMLTSSTSTVAGSCSFTIQAMDAAQQYAAQTYTLTVN